MQSTQTLPNNYRQAAAIDLTRDRGMLLALNIAGLVLMILAGWLFFMALVRMRPQDLGGGFTILSGGSLLSALSMLVGVILLTALHVILHEAIHGVFFWAFTRSRPKFAFHWTHAYAAAPNWYMARNPYLVTTLAPLVIISLVGLALFAVVPASWLLLVWFVLTMNAGGAVGDIIVAVWLLRQPATCLAQDQGSSVTLFVPEALRAEEKIIP